MVCDARSRCPRVHKVSYHGSKEGWPFGGRSLGTGGQSEIQYTITICLPPIAIPGGCAPSWDTRCYMLETTPHALRAEVC